MLGGPQMRLLTNASKPSKAEIEAGIAQAVETFLHGARPRAVAATRARAARRR
jgi:hypothetical protein